MKLNSCMKNDSKMIFNNDVFLDNKYNFFNYNTLCVVIGLPAAPPAVTGCQQSGACCQARTASSRASACAGARGFRQGPACGTLGGNFSLAIDDYDCP